MLYREASTEGWNDALIDRVDWQISREWLTRNRTSGRILDIGCYDGTFLDSLGPEWSKFGIEINRSAASVSQRKGVSIIGSDITDLRGTKNRFNTIVAFDVVEHMYDPLTFLRQLSAVCEENGIIILSSGDSDSASWKFMGSRYWYCTIPEHLSFINARWIDSASVLLGLTVLQSTRFRHAGSRVGFARRTSDLLKNIVYRTSPGLFRLLRKAGLGKLIVRNNDLLASHPPFWMSARDHLLVILKKG